MKAYSGNNEQRPEGWFLSGLILIDEVQHEQVTIH